MIGSSPARLEFAPPPPPPPAGGRSPGSAQRRGGPAATLEFRARPGPVQGLPPPPRLLPGSRRACRSDRSRRGHPADAVPSSAEPAPPGSSSRRRPRRRGGVHEAQGEALGMAQPRVVPERSAGEPVGLETRERAGGTRPGRPARPRGMLAVRRRVPGSGPASSRSLSASAAPRPARPWVPDAAWSAPAPASGSTRPGAMRRRAERSRIDSRIRRKSPRAR